MLVLFLTFCASLNLVSSSCPARCSCLRGSPRCALGVSVVRDDCGCCKVCARQLNEDCSHAAACDHTKGLECNFGSGRGAVKGICRAKSTGRPCEYDNKIYQNGEIFRPNCKHQCTCIDGAVGCSSLCPLELALPKLGCSKPRLVKVAGHCCQKLVCPEESKAAGSVIKKLKMVHEHSEDDLTIRNELVSGVRGGVLKSLPVFKSQPKSRLSSRRKCVPQTTAWSPCSKSCGPGVSFRLTNNNNQCKLLKETRLCEVHPCFQPTASSLKRGKKCSAMEKASLPVKFTYAGCRSLKMFRPRYCGSCLDGHCCRPKKTQTVPIRFSCDDGQTFSKNVMIIQSCKCDISCSHSSTEPSVVFRFFNGVHKLLD
ncbi:CCN family member 1-like [Osmerus mordax]|uniref:CCN family member 1-like n=1 Tax=Osmerus mordax TaxID=8014 RepID=UPI00350F0BDB